MEDIHQMFVKYHNFLVFKSFSKEKVPVNTSNTTPNTFNIKLLSYDGIYQIETTRHSNYKLCSD